MYDVITIGSSLVDIFVRSSHFTLKQSRRGIMLCQMYDEKIDVETFEVTTGGGGGNTAVGFSRAGFVTAVVSETGRDAFSSVVIDDLRRNCVHTNLIAQERHEQTGGSVILVGADGGRTVLVQRGASSMLDPHDIQVRPLKRSSWIHLSSIGGRLLTLKYIAEIVRENSLKCSWNPGSAELALLAKGTFDYATFPCQVLLVNAEEWKQLKAIQNKLKQHIPEIVITEGKRGGRIFTQGSRAAIKYAATSKKAVEETGAGDAFAVGYITGRLHGIEPGEAAQVGARNAASVVQYVGAKAGLLHREQLLGAQAK